MKTTKSKDLTRVKGGCDLPAGLTFESVGSFVFNKNEHLQPNTFAA